MKIELQNLTKKFPNRNRKNPGEVIAVNDFTFEIPDGQLIGLLGPSGCGKSTTLNLICGLEKPTAGKIFFGGDLRFSVLFVQGKLFSSASVILSLEQYKLTLQALVSDSCSLFDFRGFNACDLDLSF